MSPDETFALAASMLARGQALENENPPALPDALRHYDQALAALRSLPLSDESVRRDLAVALMNRGNALQRQDAPETICSAIRSYDDAIAFFRSLPLDRHASYRNALGAAWMNRGHALHRLPDPDSLAESVRSHDEAIALLRTLPLAEDRSYPINLAAAWMNQAHALLLGGDFSRALTAARESLAVTAPAEDSDPALADIGLKARRAWCEAAGQHLAAPGADALATESLADEASDMVDDGLALARKWESRGLPVFRPIAARLFRFGAQLYAAHLPDFLAEFLLEHIDPTRASGAMPHLEEFYLVADGALSRARQELVNRRTVFLETPETLQLLERLRALRSAEARLAELRAQHLA